MGLLNEIRLWIWIRQVNLWNFWICLDWWKRYECKLDIQPNLWQYCICATVERDENVESDNTAEFVTLLNKCELWIRWDCEIR